MARLAEVSQQNTTLEEQLMAARSVLQRAQSDMLRMQGALHVRTLSCVRVGGSG